MTEKNKQSSRKIAYTRKPIKINEIYWKRCRFN